VNGTIPHREAILFSLPSGPGAPSRQLSRCRCVVESVHSLMGKLSHRWFAQFDGWTAIFSGIVALTAVCAL
jgi:hypothetical protein